MKRIRTQLRVLLRKAERAHRNQHRATSKSRSVNSERYPLLLFSVRWLTCTRLSSPSRPLMVDIRLRSRYRHRSWLRGRKNRHDPRKTTAGTFATSRPATSCCSYHQRSGIGICTGRRGAIGGLRSNMLLPSELRGSLSFARLQ